MRKNIKNICCSLMVMVLAVSTADVLAGNPDRKGQAGASELLINPWARSSGFANANSASSKGLESSYMNIAGTAFTKKTEILFTNTNWLKGSDVKINALGITQRVGESGVLGLNLVAMSLGDIAITTTDQPEGKIGNFSPRFMNLGLSYAKEFSHSIYGGINVKLVSESVADLKATGVAFDAGIQYVTGKRDNMHFGISLKNVGAPLKFSGDGFAVRATLASNTASSLTVEQRSAKFEMPSLINIGGAYDLYTSATDTVHKITIAYTFVSNSFTSNQHCLGVEYGFRKMFMLRGGYVFEKDLFNDELRTTLLTGPTAGATVEVPLGKNGTTFAVDYSYRASNPFQGSHSIGFRLNL
ncbi:MAG TPA: PorV/PorQ family protein [Bacteroidia bacterium]|nr:PorV/PorQ family protein [Bacteroidia bacterium]HRH07440.1 PorV/PorQ family protein [Bacteroidia bacterium]HRH62258.1 PorV/PorQ family protein [Bacteroidia bacterium]